MRGSIPGVGHRRAGGFSLLSCDGVGEQGARRRNCNGRVRRGDAVHPAQLEPTPQSHGREERGDVVVEVRDTGTGAGVDAHPLPERAGLIDRPAAIAVLHQQEASGQHVVGPVLHRVARGECGRGATGVELTPDGEPLAAQLRTGRGGEGGGHGWSDRVGGAPALRRLVAGAQIDVVLDRRSAAHHPAARRAPAVEVALHGVVARLVQRAHGLAERVHARGDGDDPCIVETCSQGAGVSGEHVRGLPPRCGGRRRQLDLPTGLDGDPTASGQRRRCGQHLVGRAAPRRVMPVIGVPFLLDPDAGGPGAGRSPPVADVSMDVGGAEGRRGRSHGRLPVTESRRNPREVANRCGPHSAIELGHGDLLSRSWARSVRGRCRLLVSVIWLAAESPAQGTRTSVVASSRTGDVRSALLAVAVALAFADASIVVLALPPIYGEFDTTIVGVSWVVSSYAAVVAVAGLLLAVARRATVRSRAASAATGTGPVRRVVDRVRAGADDGLAHHSPLCAGHRCHRAAQRRARSLRSHSGRGSRPEGLEASPPQPGSPSGLRSAACSLRSSTGGRSSWPRRRWQCSH